MLDELRALRSLQHQQERALGAGDVAAIARLCGEGAAILRALPAGPADGERAAARAAVADIMAAQGHLERLVGDASAALARELSALAPGREALAGYRPPPRETARLFDGSR